MAASMYARLMSAHPSTGKDPGDSAASSTHRILSDLQTFIDYDSPSRHRILAASDLNIFYGATTRDLTYHARERTVWNRFDALGLEFFGPQTPNGRPASSHQPHVPGDTLNIPSHCSPG